MVIAFSRPTRHRTIDLLRYGATRPSENPSSGSTVLYVAARPTGHRRGRNSGADESMDGQTKAATPMPTVSSTNSTTSVAPAALVLTGSDARPGTW